MEVELLEQIVKNTTHKTSFQIIVSNDKSNFNTRFNPKLELDRDKVYEIVLVNLELITHFQILTRPTTYSFILLTTVIRG